MKKLRYWIQEALGFSKSEANGMVLLILLMAIILVAPYIYGYYAMRQHEVDELVLNELVLELKQNSLSDSSRRYNTDRLLSGRIKKEYFKKDWSKKRFDEIKPLYKPKYILKKFDLNLADTIQLKRIKGIGTVLSSRIIKYRKLLGGYSSKEQLKEVYGLEDSVLVSLDSLTFISDNFRPTSIFINQWDEKNLKKHPYISYTEARAISSYRYQHGNFSTIKDLLQIHLLDTTKINRLRPYLDFTAP